MLSEMAARPSGSLVPHVDRCNFLMPANYGMLLMKRDPEQYTALHLAASPVSGFMTNAIYRFIMALVDGARPPKADHKSHLATPSSTQGH